jgi:UDP-N-acetylmuramoylalanine--D-glutamate ligase
MPLDLSRLKGQHVFVVGLGRSGLATARALTTDGARVTAWDDNEERRLIASGEGFTIMSPSDAGRADLVLPSPGIPLSHPVPHAAVTAADAAQVPVIGDVELLARVQPLARIIGITGTNGKSTTTSLIGHICASDRPQVAVGGNLGPPVVELPPLSAPDRYVLELSSYQLDLCHTLTATVAVLLNIAPDHLGRHGGMVGYKAAKERIFRGQTAHDHAIVGVDDLESQDIFTRLKQEGHQRVIPISGARPVEGGVYARQGKLIDATGEVPEEIMSLSGIATLPGTHNHQNAAAAYAACRAVGVSRTLIVAGIKDFPGLDHRQQLIKTLRGVRFVNDSKATNPEAAEKALASYGAIYWIAGGQSKSGVNYKALEPLLGRVKHAYLIGEATARLAPWLLRNDVRYTRAGDLTSATQQAFDVALAALEAGEVTDPVVLLSPACASFDQFANFEARGQAFVNAVSNIGREVAL